MSTDSLSPVLSVEALANQSDQLIGESGSAYLGEHLIVLERTNALIGTEVFNSCEDCLEGTVQPEPCMDNGTKWQPLPVSSRLGEAYGVAAKTLLEAL